MTAEQVSPELAAWANEQGVQLRQDVVEAAPEPVTRRVSARRILRDVAIVRSGWARIKRRTRRR